MVSYSYVVGYKIGCTYELIQHLLCVIPQEYHSTLLAPSSLLDPIEFAVHHLGERGVTSDSLDSWYMRKEKLVENAYIREIRGYVYKKSMCLVAVVHVDGTPQYCRIVDTSNISPQEIKKKYPTMPLLFEFDRFSIPVTPFIKYNHY